MSKQVLSIEQMQHLNELGVDTSGANSMVYNISETEEYCGCSRDIVVIDGYINRYIDKRQAFTLQDILDFLPDKIMEYQLCTEKIKMIGDFRYRVSYKNNVGCYLKFFIEDELIDSAYEMLCWCIDKGYLKTKYHGS